MSPESAVALRFADPSATGEPDRRARVLFVGRGRRYSGKSAREAGLR
jgi:hypothetical protein